MISNLSSGYRSLRDLRLRLDALNVVNWASGAGKSSFYRRRGPCPPGGLFHQHLAGVVSHRPYRLELRITYQVEGRTRMSLSTRITLAEYERMIASVIRVERLMRVRPST